MNGHQQALRMTPTRQVLVRQPRHWVLSFLFVVVPALLAGTVYGEDKVPLGLDPIAHPQHNEPSAEKILLGKQLYFDGRLSADNKVSCASCHDPAKGYSNGEQFATGVEGQKGGRN